MEARNTEIALEDCIKCDLNRVGEKWKNYRRNWRLMTENVVRKKLEDEKDNGKETHGFIFE